MKELLLKDYRPVSELVVPEHQVEAPAFPIIDFHAHFGELVMGRDYGEKYDTAAVMETLKSLGIERVVNLDGGWGAELDRMRRKLEGFEDFITMFGSVDLIGFDEPGFEARTVAVIRDIFSKGVRGFKFWKMLGLGIKGKDGSYARPDDPRFQCIWQTAAELSLPVLIHIADPLAFFRPVDFRNERIEELAAVPEWSFNKPGLYSFEQLMEMQENLLESNRDTRFVVAHVGSCSENLARVGAWLDKYPNMTVDFAARLNDLGRQPYTSKAFLERYQDRVVFGTDFVADTAPLHRLYYRYLETMDEHFDYSYEEIPPQGRWKIYGVGLDRKALKKIYRDNALKLLGEI